VQAQITLATQDLPQAGEIERVCQDLAEGATYAMPQERREILDSLQVQVTMQGLDYTVTGIVPDLTLRGSLQDPAAGPGRWVHSDNTCSRRAASRPASPAGHRRRHTSRPGLCPRGGSVPGV
jgi:hypothetical protein